MKRIKMSQRKWKKFKRTLKDTSWHWKCKGQNARSQHTQKMFALYPKLYNKKQARTFENILDEFLTKKWNTLIFYVSNALNYSIPNKY